MTDIMFYLCPHDLDKRRERCLMCVDDKRQAVVDAAVAWHTSFPEGRPIPESPEQDHNLWDAVDALLADPEPPA